MIVPSKNLCINCVYCVLDDKKMYCEMGYFDCKIQEGTLNVPYDFECINFEAREDEENER